MVTSLALLLGRLLGLRLEDARSAVAVGENLDAMGRAANPLACKCLRGLAARAWDVPLVDILIDDFAYFHELCWLWNAPGKMHQEVKLMAPVRSRGCPLAPRRSPRQVLRRTEPRRKVYVSAGQYANTNGLREFCENVLPARIATLECFWVGFVSGTTEKWRTFPIFESIACGTEVRADTTSWR